MDNPEPSSAKRQEGLKRPIARGLGRGFSLGKLIELGLITDKLDV